MIFGQFAGNASAGQQPPPIKNLSPEEAGKRVTHIVLPEYPESARQSHITGTIEIGLVISPSGEVSDGSRVLTGPSPLAQVAVDAIRQWKFRPDVEQGKPTSSRIRALVRFNVDGTTEVALAPAILADSFGDPGSKRNAALETRIRPIVHGSPIGPQVTADASANTSGEPPKPNPQPVSVPALIRQGYPLAAESGEPA